MRVVIAKLTKEEQLEALLLLLSFIKTCNFLRNAQIFHLLRPHAMFTKESELRLVRHGLAF